MKKKFLGRVLTMLLVASMVFTLLPASAIAAGNWWWNADEYTEEALPAATADNSYQYNIFFLDCGRKYFSVDSIKALIDNASAAGFNYIQLAVGNDGLRLLLDDMTLEVNGTTYGSDAVKAAIQTGNRAYNAGFKEKDGHKTYNPEKNELTEGEMNAIIAYAKSKGMGVIPCVNTPGHMDAILSAATSLAGTNCSYNGSARTIDVTNATAVAFTKALLQKYIAYFRSQGCQLFNMGADEYANDVYKTGGMGFAHLKSQRQYVYYVNYINAVATMIEDAGMTPMAFNDGIYYGGDKSTTINKNIVICYWSSGWSGYEVRSAKNLVDDGFTMINTHGDYYYVLGKSDKYDEFGTSYASRFNRYNFIDGSTIQQPAGSMLCVWCDYPGDEDEATILSNTPDIIKNFGSTLPKLNTTPVQPDTGITITPEGGATGKLDSAAGESIVLDAGKVVTWSYDPALVTLASADAASDVALADLTTLSARRVTVTPVAGASGTATITAADDDGHSATFPIEVVNSAASTGVTVDLKVGDDKTVPVKGHNYANDVGKAELNEDIATVTVTGKDAVPEETNYPVVNPTYYEILDDNSSSWVKTKYFYSNDNGSNYYPVYAKRTSSGILWWTTYKYTLGYSVTGSSSNVNEIASYDTDSTSNQPTKIVLYGQPTVVPATPASTTITFHGVAEGTTYVTIGGTKYTINVSYYEQPVNVVLNQSKTVEVSGTLNAAGLDTGVATVSVSADGKTMTVTGKAKGETSVIVGNTRYKIKVDTENLEAVNPLKIEYWITNKSIAIDGAKMEERTKVLKDEEYPVYYQNILATAANSEEGVMIDTYAPSPAEVSKTTYVYWLSRILDTKKDNTTGSGTEAQTADNGDDETQSGSAFSKIRYYQSKWSVFTENNEWVDVDAKHQLVAYYMQQTEVTSEVTTTVVDWGVSPATNLSWDKSEFGLVDFAVKYEDGQQFPTTFPTDKTVAYAGVETTKAIGQIRVVESDEYEVYMITLTRSSDNATDKVASSITDLSNYEYKGAEKVVWVDDESNLGSFDKHENYRAGGDATIPSLTLVNCQGVLVTYYLRTKVTEDSLTVNYVDLANPSAPFYSYNIAVVSGTTFKSNIRLDDPAEQELLDGDVVNIKNKTQTVTADLKKMNGVPAAYRYASKFTCDHIALSGEDKVLTLYYTFDNSVSFVADFGLPLTIEAKELSNAFNNGSQITETKVSSSAQYGTVSFTGKNNMNIVYTPGKTFPSSNGDTFTVTYTGKNPESGKLGSASFVINILPATNVLYEENFLTAANDSGWTKAGSSPITEQETQKVNGGGSYNVFGYDNAYVKNGEQNVTGQLGVWQASGLQYSTSTGVMTTEFYGNGFDLIGSCGKNTGRILLGIFKGNEKRPVATRIIDTKFDDANVAEMLYQVPLAHVMLKDEAQYRVEIYASGVKEQTNNARANSRSVSAAAYSYDDYADGFASILDSYGVRMSDVECISFADIADSASAAATMSLRPVALAVEGAAGSCSVEIDSFRVYRSANDTNYPENEKNVTYTNVLDAFKNGGFTAFTENGGGKWTTRGDYESNGGPQNEIYLRSSDGTAGDAVAFSVGANQTVQISARAVESNGKTAKMVVNGDISVGISSNTEMYYVVTAGDDGIITIKNIGEAMLALGNLKVKSTQTVAELSDEQIPMAIALLSMAPAPEEPEQPAAFTPEHFDAKVSATRLGRNKIVRLTVTTSSDVAKLTVNGKELRPVNGWLVKMGWSSSYTYILSEKMPRNGSKPFEIICYNADGVASAARVVTGQ